MVLTLEGREKIYLLGKILCCRWSFGNLTFIVKAKIKKDSSAVYSHTKTRPVLRLQRSFLHHWKCIKKKRNREQQTETKEGLVKNKMK